MRFAAPRELEPIAARKHDVENSEIGGRGENRIGTGAVGETGDREPLARESACDRLPDRLLVLDQHNAWRPRSHVAQSIPPQANSRREGRAIFSLSTGCVATLLAKVGAPPLRSPSLPAPPESPPQAKTARHQVWLEGALAVVAFAVMCIAVLSVAAQTAEPDDGAYRASIVAMTEGHFLTLSTSQAEALAAKLGDNPAAPPNQWVQLADGRFISEKDPGYPFLAAPFQQLGLIRWAPLLFGALACLGLFLGARRWLGSFGGFAAVGLYCSSGAALAFAWRDYMPTFTDASLVAAGSGILLWALLATEASSRRRTWAGLAGFVALELATFVRYTNVVILGCAVMAVTRHGEWGPHDWASTRWASGSLSLVAFCLGLALFDDLVYGGPFKTGYHPGEVTFALGAVGPNLRLMPAHLIQAMPMLILGLAALVWIVVQRLLPRRASGARHAIARRDLAVGVVLAGSWFAIWAFYSRTPGPQTRPMSPCRTSGSTSRRSVLSRCSARGS